MPKLVFTQDEIDGYLKEKKEFRHFFYDRTIQIADSMKVHADGLFPKTLIEERRPNEPMEVKNYRKQIFIAKTKPAFSKVFSSLQKIRRSSDWNIRYENLEDFTRIIDEEDLEQYTEVKFPYFTSITNWVFSLLLRKYLIDPNAVVVVLPLSFDVLENQFLEPFPIIFDSVDVLEFKQNDYAVLHNPMGAIYKIRNKEELGRSYYFITTEEILKYDQVDSKGNFKLTLQQPHELTILPVFKLKGVLIDQTGDQTGSTFLYESRLSGMIPELDEAIREYSDLQAAKVLHIYPERWEYTNNECGKCKGSGQITNPAWFEGCAAASVIDCTTCAGRGYVVAGPYSKIMVKPPNALEAGGQVPTPPAGYVEKDVEIIKIQQLGVEDHIYQALSAVNFEFLAKTPLSQSGVAKEVDKDELNNTVHSIAEDVVSAMDNLYRMIAYYRYKTLYPLDKIEEMLPVIAVPEKFDILSSTHLEESLTAAKTNKFNPAITNAAEISYAGKFFNADPKVRDTVMLILELDPLANITEDEKMSRLSNNGITQETYVISSNIQEFVQRAIEENEKFTELDTAEQKKIMLKYATEQIASIDKANQIKLESQQEAMSEGGLNEIPKPEEIAA